MEKSFAMSVEKRRPHGKFVVNNRDSWHPNRKRRQICHFVNKVVCAFYLKCAGLPVFGCSFGA